MAERETQTGRNTLAGLPVVSSRRLRRNLLYRHGVRTFRFLGRRTSSTLQDNSTWNYTYNQRSEITSAIRKNASNVTQNTMRYGFVNIGNRTSSYENPTSKTYSANSLNQYTGINVVGSSSITPQYNNDGNMTGYGSWTYTWDIEFKCNNAIQFTFYLDAFVATQEYAKKANQPHWTKSSIYVMNVNDFLKEWPLVHTDERPEPIVIEKEPYYVPYYIVLPRTEIIYDDDNTP